MGDSWTWTGAVLVLLDDAGEEEDPVGGGGADGVGNLCLIVPARAFFLVG